MHSFLLLLKILLQPPEKQLHEDWRDFGDLTPSKRASSPTSSSSTPIKALLGTEHLYYYPQKMHKGSCSLVYISICIFLFIAGVFAVPPNAWSQEDEAAYLKIFNYIISDSYSVPRPTDLKNACVQKGNVPNPLPIVCAPLFHTY